MLPAYPDVIDWATRDTWVPHLTRWLAPHLRRHALKDLRREYKLSFADCGEAFVFLRNILKGRPEDVEEQLAEALGSCWARAFHACRTEDVRAYTRHGIRYNHVELVEQFRTIVAGDKRLAELQPRVDELVAETAGAVISDDFPDPCGFGLDGRALVRTGAQHLLYGSLTLATWLGPIHRGVLASRGAPTIVAANVPLGPLDWHVRRSLAAELLREWAVQASRPPEMWYVEEVEFDFDMPGWVHGDLVVGHSHPPEFPDVVGWEKHKPARRFCAHCEMLQEWTRLQVTGSDGAKER